MARNSPAGGVVGDGASLLWSLATALPANEMRANATAMMVVFQRYQKVCFQVRSYRSENEAPWLYEGPTLRRRQRVDSLHRKLTRRTEGLMAERGLSVNRLADFSDVGRGRLSEILAGKSSPTPRTLGRLADALGVSVRDLLPDDEPVRPPR